MKKIFTFLYSFAFALNAVAQNPQLWGLTSLGGTDGPNGAGAIIKINGDGSGFTTSYPFEVLNPGGSPYSSNLLQAANGLLYGLSGGGGANNKGVIFSYNPNTGAYFDLFDFNNIDGTYPHGSLVQDSNGILYGMTNEGGTNGYGVIFSYNPDNAAYSRLLNFNDTIGAYPFGNNLLFGNNGLYYGLTSQGGAYGYGVIFSYNINTLAYNVLFNFNDTTGAYPYSGLLQDSNGLLYGMTFLGGANNYGLIFSYNAGTGTYSDIFDFTDTLGAYPYGGLIQDSNGLLYGATAFGGADSAGVIFSYNPGTAAYTKLYDFNLVTGASPDGSLLQAGNGVLYGMASTGGAYNYGAVFVYNINNNSYADIFDFNDTTGATPHGSLIQSDSGILYAMTSGGGGGSGVIFSYNLNTSTYADLINFNVAPNGANPYGCLLQGNNGLLYGLTSEGGAHGSGVIFAYNPGTHINTDLFDFNDSTGAYPYGSLVYDSTGIFYGLTAGGGLNGDGVIFSYNLNNSAYTDLFDFYDSLGLSPYGSLLQANNGILYGMTSFGGVDSIGVMFSYNPGTAAYTKLLDFNYTNGGLPKGSLAQGSNGLIYGMTEIGGTGDNGIIFSYDAGTAAYTNLFSFNYTNGAYPAGNLVQDSNGVLYGTTGQGGANGYGVIFSYTPGAAGYTKLFDFNYTNGAYPDGSLTLAANGLLYGMTNNGGANNEGVIFSYNLATATYTKLMDLSSVTGAHPQFGNLLAATNFVSTGQPTGPFCAGSTISVPFLSLGNFDTGNVFTAQLSNDSGSFANPQNIGTSASGNWVNGLLPDSISGTGYRLRVVSSLPPITDSDNGNNLTISPLPPAPTITKNADTLTSSPASLYQWYLNSNPINDSTAASLIISQNGQYQVQITDTDGCPNISAIYNVTTLGMEEINLANGIKLYPNPAGDELTVQFDLFINNDLTLKLYDISGKLEALYYMQSGDKFIINTSGMAAGIYWLKVSINGEDVSRSFVKEGNPGLKR